MNDMGVINLLASQQGLRGGEANITLARQIAETDNKTAIIELVENLSNKDKRIQSDCNRPCSDLSASARPERVLKGLGCVLGR
jgi:hypothetical protein